MADSGDGAQLGYTARGALGAILGDETQVPQADLNTPAGMAYYLSLAPSNPVEYDDAARLIGKLAMEHLQAHPEDVALNAWDMGDLIFDTHPELVGMGFTGFQVGWGVNAARFALHAPPVNNPSLVTIGSDDEA